MKNRRGTILKRILAIMLTVALLPVGGMKLVKAADADKIAAVINVTYGQAEAREMIKWVNQDRAAAGAQELKYDYSIENYAIRRAEGIALVYDENFDADGAPVNREGWYYYISSGSQTAKDVYENWKTNISSMENVSAMGVGHVIYNGRDYWVAIFSNEVLSEKDPSVKDSNGTATVYMDSSRITSYEYVPKSANQGIVSLNVGDTFDIAGDGSAVLGINGHQPADEKCPVESCTANVTSSDQAVVAVVGGDRLYAIQDGEVTISLSCGSFKSEFHVRVGQGNTSTGPVDFSKVTIDVIPDQSYTGYQVTPQVTVRYGGKVLTQNTDYTLLYFNNINMGTAQVVVTGTGMYTGSKTATFRITVPTLANATVVSIPDQAYTGSPIYPGVTIYTNNGLLQEGIDYRLSYTNNINMGTAYITITGTGNYSGTKTVTFRITGPNLSSATISAIPDQVYTGQEIRPAVTVTLNGMVLNQNSDYYVSYTNNRNIGSATVTVTGRGNYSGTKTTYFRILGRDIGNTTVSSVASQRYTGDEIRPDVTVTLGSTVLTKNVDYTLTYKNNVSPGTASIVITGAGSYSGSKTVTFKITQASLAGATVKVSNQTYNGKAKRPNVVVKIDGEELDEDQDYEVVYSNNKKPGKATVEVSGTGYYSGTKKATFIILPKKMTLSSAKANGRDASLVWKRDTNVTGYEVYRSKKKSSGYKRIATFNSNKTTACTNMDLSSGTYYFKVRSYILVDGTKYYSAYSNIKRVTIR